MRLCDGRKPVDLCYLEFPSLKVHRRWRTGHVFCLARVHLKEVVMLFVAENGALRLAKLYALGFLLRPQNPPLVVAEIKSLNRIIGLEQ